MAETMMQESWTPREITKRYSSEPTPLASYAAIIGAYHVMLLGLTRLASRKKAPERIGLADLLLLLPATHKLSRIITKDWVTSPIRAPFTEYQGNAGGGEITEKARGSGMQKAIGDLLTCQYCIGPWVAGALVYGLVAKPRQTRLFASIFALVAGSDFLHFAYQSARAKQSEITESAQKKAS